MSDELQTIDRQVIRIAVAAVIANGYVSLLGANTEQLATQSVAVADAILAKVLADAPQA